MGPIGCTETSVTTNMRCVTSLKSECIILKHTYIYRPSYELGRIILYCFYGMGTEEDGQVSACRD